MFQHIFTSSSVPPPILDEAFVEALKATGIPISLDGEDRVFRSHGKTCREEIWETLTFPGPFNLGFI